MIKMIATGIVGLLIGAVTVGALTAQQDGAELRVIARPLEDGRTEFAIRDANGEQHLPASRFLPTRAEVERRGWVGRWLPSSPVTIGAPAPLVVAPETDGPDSVREVPPAVLGARRFADQFAELGSLRVRAVDQSTRVAQCRDWVNALRERSAPASARFARELDRWCEAVADDEAIFRASGVAANRYADRLRTVETASDLVRYSNAFIVALERHEGSARQCETAGYSAAREARSYAGSGVERAWAQFANDVADFATRQGEGCATLGNSSGDWTGLVGEIRDLSMRE